MYQVRFNTRTFHIEGIAEATKPGHDDDGSGVIGYYAQSACSALTRSASRMNEGRTFTDLAEALRNTRIAARVNGRNLCAHCEKAAERVLAATPPPASRAVEALKALPAGTDVALYTFGGATVAGKITGHRADRTDLVTVQDDATAVAHEDIESIEYWDEAAENWIDPAEETPAEEAPAAPVADVRRFVCLSCGATDEAAECITGPVHRTPRRMLPADYERHMASRRPVDKVEAAARREAIRNARKALADRMTEATVDPLSPTAQAVAAASTARDAAMRAAFEVEGTEREGDLDAVYRAAEGVHADAQQVHRHALDDSRARTATAEATAALEFELADSEPARTQYLTARIALAAGNTLTSCDGSTMRPHVIAPAYLIAERLDLPANRFGVFVEGAAVVYAETLAEALTRVPEALADVAASCEPGDYAPTGCVAADLHECWSRALCETDTPEPETDPAADLATALAAIDAATATLTPERARFYNSIGPALVGDAEPDTDERPSMTKYQVTINQVVTTTVYVEAPAASAALDLAVDELPELCIQCAGGGPRESSAVTEVSSYVNDHYDEAVVRELDEYGCLLPTPDETHAAETSFAQVVADVSLARDGGPVRTHVAMTLDPQGRTTPKGPGPVTAEDVLDVLDDEAPRVVTGVSLNPDGNAEGKTHTRLKLPEVLARNHQSPPPLVVDLDPQERPEAADSGDAEAMRAYDLAEREYLYQADRYSRTGLKEDGDDLDEALDRYRAAAVAAHRCAVVGVDHSCREITVSGEAECPAHLNGGGREEESSSV